MAVKLQVIQILKKKIVWEITTFPNKPCFHVLAEIEPKLKCL